MIIPSLIQQLSHQTRPVSSEQIVITAREIKSILYLGLPGGVDNPREVENHTVDTYA